VTLFDRLVAQLLTSTQASRVTVRLCEEGVDPRLVAEGLAPGVTSMASGSRDSIRTAGTYVYLEQERRILVQNDCRTSEPAPPASLIELYKVYAQMLAPVFVAGEMVATIPCTNKTRREPGPKPKSALSWTREPSSRKSSRVFPVANGAG